MSADQKEQIQYLLLQYLEGKASKEQKTLLFNSLAVHPDKEWEPLLEELIAAGSEDNQYQQKDWEPLVQKIIDKSRATKKPGKLSPLFVRIAVAASVLLFVTLGILYLRPGTKRQEDSIAVNTKDVKAPEINRAQLRLADGRIIYLDSAGMGELMHQDNVAVQKRADGSLVYDAESVLAGNQTVQYHTLSNPRGSKVINLDLSDGSRVWLNTGSSIRFPTQFPGAERRVSIEGEAYFEVAKNAASPFKVNVNGKQEVEVLGTHFNINSYDDEDVIRTTLLEGSVKVSWMGSGLPAPDSRLLKPGEQAVADPIHHSPFTILHPDLEEVMAWKNGKFDFQDLDIQSVMRQLGKWYDVEVEYRGTITRERFIGVISRNVNISEIVTTLEKTGAVDIEIAGKKLIVK